MTAARYSIVVPYFVWELNLGHTLFVERKLEKNIGKKGTDLKLSKSEVMVEGWRISILINIKFKSSPYLTGNTLCLRYRAQPVNAVWVNRHCLL
jgi:hypothetical protein